MDVRLGYKQTDVGVIPAAWEVATLADLGTWRGGMTPSMQNPAYWDGGVFPWVSSGDIKVTRLADTSQHVTSLAVRDGAAVVVPTDSLVLVTRSGILRKYLPVALVKKPMAINQDIKALSPNEAVSPEFLLYAITGYGGAILARCLKSGTTVESVEFPWLKAFVIPLPPLPEQRAIAAALSDVDALLDGLDRVIAKKRDLKQAAMQQLLPGQTRLPGFHGQWEVRALRDIVSSPITDGPHLTPKFLPDGVPFLSVNNLANNRLDLRDLRFVSKEDHFEFSKKCRPRRGDILFGKAASVGMVALIDTDVELNIWSPLALIRVGKDASPHFVYYALQTSRVHQQIKALTNASSQGNIGMGEIGLLEVPLPRRDEQVAIATVLSDMDGELAALEARRGKTGMLKLAMMQELLTGRTRLMPAGHADA